jgi:hypothetical protein
MSYQRVSLRIDGGASSQLSQLAPRLLQPEPHVHRTVHRRGGGEVLFDLLAVGLAKRMSLRHA